MNLLNEDAIFSLFGVSRKYLPAISGVILSVPILFYLLVVRSPAVELVYTFRIINATESFFYDVCVESDKAFHFVIPPKSDSELFTIKIGSSVPGFFPEEMLRITLHCEDSLVQKDIPLKPTVRSGNRISPDRLNRIRILPRDDSGNFVITTE